MAAGGFLLTTALVMTSIFFDAASAFGEGILAGNPDATGTFTWTGISYLQTMVTYTVTDRAHTFAGGAFTPLTYALLAIGTIAVGRLWRALPLGAGTTPHRPDPGGSEPEIRDRRLGK